MQIIRITEFICFFFEKSFLYPFFFDYGFGRGCGQQEQHTARWRSNHFSQRLRCEVHVEDRGLEFDEEAARRRRLPYHTSADYILVKRAEEDDDTKKEERGNIIQIIKKD